MKEYRLLCQAQRLKNIDRQYWINAQAYASNKAGLRDRQGRLIYRDFKKLFDYEKALEQVGKQSRKRDEPEQIRKLKEYMKHKKQERRKS